MRTPTSDVSVVIPARNVENYLAETLQSVAAQTFTEFEVVIIDDGSTDRTRQIAEEQARADLRFSVLPGNGEGVSVARNQGSLATTAPFLLFLDADDLLAPTAFEHLHKSLKDAPPSTVASLGRIKRIDENGRDLKFNDNLKLVDGNDPFAALLRKNYIVNGGALMIRRTAAEAAGLFDPDLKYGEDWEFWVRLLSHGNLTISPQGDVLAYRQRATGANYNATASRFAPGRDLLRKVAENPNVRAKAGRKLRSLLRQRQIDMFWAGVRNEYAHGARAKALSTALAGVVLYPDSMLQPALAMRLLKTLGR